MYVIIQSEKVCWSLKKMRKQTKKRYLFQSDMFRQSFINVSHWNKLGSTRQERDITKTRTQNVNIYNIE